MTADTPRRVCERAPSRRMVASMALHRHGGRGRGQDPASAPKTGLAEIVSSGLTSCRRLARQRRKQQTTRITLTMIGPTALSSPKS